VRAAAPRGGRAGRRTATPAAGIPLRLAHRGPYQPGPVFDLLEREAVEGVEDVTGTPGARTHRRTLRLPYGTGITAVDERPGTARTGSGARPGGWLDARIHLTDLRDLTTAVQRLRRLFDLDADPYAVDERLGADPRLAPLVAARPGLRSPGTADPDELAVRALVGRDRAARLVQRYGKTLDAPCGTLTHLFPEPATLADAAPGGALGALTTALADGAVRLGPGADRDAAADALSGVPGLDARTIAVIRTRALGDPDVALPAPDLPDSWRPWRSYALNHLRAAGELEYP
ncbi:AlkA N-terminal domain-containing protein, partial [Streptomyces sp. Sce081]|uniref:AlkA N-terminal domain-containing protein n=1 Tax=Streptomyces sp. Sce081 TaxID=3349853 RepID=UPI0035F3DEE1